MTRRTTPHAHEAELALLAGGDLGFWRRMRVAAHVRGCAQCRGIVTRFADAREQARNATSELPPGLNWNELAREMSANIRVGLEAGECIEHLHHASRRRMLSWNLTTVLATTALVGICALWLRLPAPQAEHLRAALTSIVRGKNPAGTHTPADLLSSATVLEASPSGPAVQENGSSMKLLVPRSSEAVSVSVNLQDSVSARYVDADSGQVTINRVYYAQ